MERIILHCDLNNFFASVECVLNPALRDVPMAVCGNEKERHGIVLAKNELAKKFNVKTAEVIWQARQKCPDLVCVPPHMNEYAKISKAVFDIYCEYTDLVEPFGIDECWLDVTGSTLLFGSGEEIAITIKERIKAELGVTISAGVSFSKVFAKLGSDMKKPDAVTVIDKDNYRTKVWTLSADMMIGIGRSTSERLSKYGIRTIGDIALAEMDFLTTILGKRGEEMWHWANGHELGAVAHQSDYTVAKSVGNSSTAKEDLTTSDEVWKLMYKMADSVSTRLREQHLLAGGVQITIKNTNLSSKEYQAQLKRYTCHPKELANAGMELFNQNYNWSLNVRLVGITAINLVPEDEAEQLSLTTDLQKQDEIEALEQGVFCLRKRYGKSSVRRGSLI